MVVMMVRVWRVFPLFSAILPFLPYNGLTPPTGCPLYVKYAPPFTQVHPSAPPPPFI